MDLKGNTIISNDSISREQILENLHEYIKTLPNYADIKDTLNTSTMEVIYQLLAGFGTWEVFRLNMARRESMLSTAQKANSVYTLARSFGYNIRRAIAPEIKVRYLGDKTIPIKSGMVLGTAREIPLTYFGKSRLIEKGDELTIYAGHYVSLDGVVGFTPNDKSHVKQIATEKLKYIDDNLINIYTRKGSYEITKSVEDYVVFNSIADFSISPSATKIYIRDEEFGYGNADFIDGTRYTLEYIETDGFMDSLTLPEVELQSQDWLPIEILTYGTLPEPLDKIRELAPLLYSTMRRAITEKDYDYLSKAHSLVLDTKTVTELGTPGEWEIQLKSTTITADPYTINISNDIQYSTIGKQGEPATDTLQRLASQVNAQGWATAEVQAPDKLYLVNRDNKVKLTILGNSKFNPAVTIVQPVPPPCCTISIYYIKFGQTRTGPVLVLTDAERKTYAQHLQKVKMAGLSIILTPASRKSIDLDITIKLQDPTMQVGTTPIAEYLEAEVRAILERDYEFKLNTDFMAHELLASITKIQIVKEDFTTLQPITACYYNSTTNDIPADSTTYLVVDNLNLKFE